MENTPISTTSRNTLSLFNKRKYYEEHNCAVGCAEPLKYEKVSKIGQGTFGEVFKARRKSSTNEKFVAMKRVLMDNAKEGFPINTLREIKILKLLQHENIVNLIEIYSSKATAKNDYTATFYLIFDFCEHDLAGLLLNVNVKFTLAEIKKIMQQLLRGLYYIHGNKVLHRDLKPANILITKNGVLKLADFGLSRPIDDAQKCYTNRVVTLCYRSPELLLGVSNYGPAIDMWSVGCIMAEMWTRSAIFRGDSEIIQLKLISLLCGSLTTDVWPGLEQVQLFKFIELPKNQKRCVKERFMPYIKDRKGCDLLDKLLTLDPTERIHAAKALDHDFFWTDPMPCDLGKMLSQYSQSMFEYLARQKRDNRQQLTTRTQKSTDANMINRV